eukprot:3003432-Pyramimonas_sp.AAC.1
MDTFIIALAFASSRSQPPRLKASAVRFQSCSLTCSATARTVAELSQAFKQEFQKILDMEKIKAKEHLDKLMQCLRGRRPACT